MSTASGDTGGVLDHGEARALVDRARVAFNDKDIDAFLAVMQPNAVFDHAASPVVLEGHEALRGFYADGVWPAFSDMRLDLLEGPFLHPSEPRFMVAWRFSGTHAGRLDPPGLDPTGRTVDVVLHERALVVDGQLASLVIVLDVARLLRQLGVLPASGTGGERLMLAARNLSVRAGRLFG